MSFVSVMLIEDTSKTTAIAAMRAAIVALTLKDWAWQ